MSKKQWSWQKKLVVVILVIIAGYGGLRVWGLIAWKAWARRSLTPKVYTFASTAELGEQQKAELEGLLRIEIPKSARETYFLKSSSRDLVVFCSFILPSREIYKFAEEFTGAPFSNFHKAEDYWEQFGGSSYAMRGPTIWGEKWKTAYWNIRDVYERCIYFETDKHFPGRRNFMIVDPDTNRVYLCVH